ncbi:CPBP family intramembrane glutamic endopeptidase [Leptolyngbya ohadii]|uniref:CPBP family intramembrane glutamic endopeptidase n=1 Tax=Leptolyngbya ohadii TaxID=1962290 RepID=UPI000B59CBF7|nr:type II CAAX endopeptidase family protein [Leptolyngbya ohadii]
MLKNSPRLSAALALCLLVPAASMGTAAGLYVPGTIGQLIFAATKVWLLAFPLIWFLQVDRGKVALSFPLWRDLLGGIALGLLMFGVIVGAYSLVGQQWIDPAIVQAKAQQVGLTEPKLYLLGAFYFTFINSLAEEYIWRWFVYQRCEVLVPGKRAIALAALCFTLHHMIALLAYTGSVGAVALGSLGVFLAGAIWSWCYLTYRSLWACYVSHLLADLAIGLIGWKLLFA